MLVVFFGCEQSPDRELPAQQSPATAPEPLELRLNVPARVRSGEPVPLRLVLENRGDRPVEVELTGQPIAFDFVVIAADGAEVWRRLEGVAVTSILQPRTLAAGAEIEFTDSWRQQNNDGRTVTPGYYRVQGILHVPGMPAGWGTESRTLTIVP